MKHEYRVLVIASGAVTAEYAQKMEAAVTNLYESGFELLFATSHVIAFRKPLEAK